MNRIEALALMLLVIVALAVVVWGLSGCIENVNVQVGPDHWPGATTRPQTIVEILKDDETTERE